MFSKNCYSTLKGRVYNFFRRKGGVDNHYYLKALSNFFSFLLLTLILACFPCNLERAHLCLFSFFSSAAARFS
jgi:hypothetical protein